MNVSIGCSARRVVFGVVLGLFGITAGAQASDGGFQFGARAGASLNQYYVNMSWFPTKFDPGYSSEIGLAAKYRLTGRFSLSSELSFCHRLVTNYRWSGESSTYDDDENGEMVFMGDYYYEDKGTMREMAVLFPVMLQFTPVKSGPFNLSAGIQFGVPFNYKSKETSKQYTLERELLREDTRYDNDGRYPVDYGAAAGVGYMITPNLGVDTRFVFNMNNFFTESPNTWFMYLTLGVSYFL